MAIFGDWIPAFEGVAQCQTRSHSDTKSQNLGSDEGVQE